MEINLAESLTFTVPLGSSTHRLAQKLSKQHNQKKAKQVYLNTLAISAVKFYLCCMGVETHWEASLSWNPVMQSLMDVADLHIPGLGTLECRPVLPAQVVHIPPEVWSDRIGYVAVQLEQSLQKATLLGFVQTVSTIELPLNQLRSLEDLLEHLYQLKQSEPVKHRVNLSQWFGNFFQADWQPLERFLVKDQENLAFGLRSSSRLAQVGVKGAKLINLGLQLRSQSVALLVAIAPEAEQKIGILVQVHPLAGANGLPFNLKLSLLSESGATLQEVQSRTQDNYIQLKRFRGLPGECFNIQVACGDASVTESFIL